MDSLKIRVVGVGGGGCHAAEAVAKSGVVGIECLALDTDAMVLRGLKGVETVLLGEKLLRGLSTGGDFGLAKRVFEEERERLREIVEGVDLLFIVVGLGGGLGTVLGAHLAHLAKKAKAAVLAFGFLPFSIEGNRRSRAAELGLNELRLGAHAAIPLPNDILLQQVEVGGTVLEAFELANSWVVSGVKGICESIFKPGVINLDFMTLRNMVRDSGGGKTLFGLARGEGENVVEEVMRRLPLCPLLYVPHGIQRASSIMLNIKGGRGLTLDNVKQLADMVGQQFGSRENTILGAILDEEMGDAIEVCIIGVMGTNREEGGRRGRNRLKEDPHQQVLFDEKGVPLDVKGKRLMRGGGGVLTILKRRKNSFTAEKIWIFQLICERALKLADELWNRFVGGEKATVYIYQGEFFEFLEGNGVGDVEFIGCRAAKLDEVSATAELLSDIVCDGSHVSPFARTQCEREGGGFEGVKLNFRDVDEAGFALDFFALASEFIKRNALYLFCGEHGWELVLVAAKFV